MLIASHPGVQNVDMFITADVDLERLMSTSFLHCKVFIFSL